MNAPSNKFERGLLQPSVAINYDITLGRLVRYAVLDEQLISAQLAEAGVTRPLDIDVHAGFIENKKSVFGIYEYIASKRWNGLPRARIHIFAGAIVEKFLSRAVIPEDISEEFNRAIAHEVDHFIWAFGSTRRPGWLGSYRTVRRDPGVISCKNALADYDAGSTRLDRLKCGVPDPERDELKAKLRRAKYLAKPQEASARAAEKDPNRAMGATMLLRLPQEHMPTGLYARKGKRHSEPARIRPGLEIRWG